MAPTVDSSIRSAPDRMGLAAAHAAPVLSPARNGGDEFVGVRLAGAAAVSNEDVEAAGVRGEKHGV